MIPTYNDIPCWYLASAILITVYQSYRGFMFQSIFSHGIKKENNDKFTPFEKYILLCCADMFFYFTTTMTGFIALFMAYFILHKIQSITDISTGVVTIEAFLVVYGVLGITAQLPGLIQQGKFPWNK